MNRDTLEQDSCNTCGYEEGSIYCKEHCPHEANIEQEPCEDEYIKVPKKALKYRTAGMVAYNAEWLKNNFDIERAVICGVQETETEKVVKMRNATPEERESVDNYIKGISKPTGVNFWDLEQEPKKGHWIMSDDGLYRPICDKCGAHPWKGYIPTVEEATEVFKYCPNCGCRMVEPQERSK